MAMSFKHLFTLGRPSIIGMVHVRALPGAPLNQLTMKEIVRKACDEALILKDRNVDGLIIENMHDIPYQNNAKSPEVTAAMTVVCSKVRDLCSQMPIGVQILSGANLEAIAVAKAAGLDFIRAEGFVFAHVADEGYIESCAGNLLRYRKTIGAENIGILTDIKKKHSSHAITSDLSLSETAKAAEFFLSDGLIVTGSTTGNPANLKDVSEVQKASELPVLVGSGVAVDNLEDYLSVNGLIIGSHFKENGDWRNELDENRIEKFMKKFREKCDGRF